jgi:signal transduction histidine kinase
MNNLSWDFLNYVAALLLSGITTLILGFFVLIKNRKARLNQLFFACSLAIAAWSLAQSTMHTAYNLTWIGSKIVHFAAPFIAVFFLHFAAVIANRPNKKILWITYAIGIICSILGGFSKTIVVALWPMKVSETFTLAYTVKAGILYIPYMLFFALAVLYAIYIMFKEFSISTGAKRNQLKYMLIGATVGFSGGVVNFCYPFRINLYPLTPFATYTIPVYALIAAYAILKHRLLDIKVALSRTGLLFVIYGLIIYVSFNTVVFLQPYLEKTYGTHWVYFPIALYTALISLSPFLYIYIQKKMEDKIFKTQHQYQKTLKQLSTGMTRIRNLNKLLDLTVIQIVRTVKITHATIFLYDKNTNKYILKTSRGELKKKVGLELEPSSLLLSWLFDTRAPIVYDDLDEFLKRPEFNAITSKASDIRHLRLQMKQLQAAVCIPGFIEDQLIGFLLLGEKTSGDMYTQDDLDAFSTLTNQAVLAIENAQSYEELSNTRDQLIKSERLATLGEFASEVAHEIKNPLQSIKAFTELINEKYNDKEFREKFSWLVAGEIDRIDNFVRQLVKVAHPAPVELTSTNITEILDSVLELMENELSSKGITIKKDYQSKPVQIKADKNQLKQVFLNLITNACDAMEGTDKKSLSVSAYSFQSHAVIKISDTGCGIPPESIPRLFNPLFTTKERGTGLGLNIVDTIIKSHKGNIAVESEAGKGSTFTLTI